MDESKRCSQCGEYNPSFRKSPVCSGCKYSGYPHEFSRPSNRLRNERFAMSAMNCHCTHSHSECTPDCSVYDCYRVGAELGSCAICIRPITDPIHTQETGHSVGPQKQNVDHSAKGNCDCYPQCQKAVHE